MKTIEELQQEMKTLMDLEIVRMKIRHHELMWWVIPRLVIAVTMMAILIYVDWRFTR